MSCFVMIFLNLIYKSNKNKFMDKIIKLTMNIKTPKLAIFNTVPCY
jgi:hypothetical protein